MDGQCFLRDMSTLTSASGIPLGSLKPRSTATTSDWLLGPLAILPAVEAGTGARGRNGISHAAPCHRHHKLTRHSLREAGEVHSQLGALLVEEVQGQQGHAGALVLESQVEASLGERAQAQRLDIHLPSRLSPRALPGQVFSSHCVHLPGWRRDSLSLSSTTQGPSELSSF